MTTAEEVRISEQSIAWTKVVWVVLSVLGTIWLVVISRFVFFTPPPAKFLSAEIITRRVQALGKPALSSGPGVVKLKAIIDAPLDPKCLTGTQYFMEFPDGSSIKMPGFRRTFQADNTTAIYETAVPRYAPPGPAVFWIRDNYNCGIQAQRADSPKLTFLIVEPKDAIAPD